MNINKKSDKSCHQRILFDSLDFTLVLSLSKPLCHPTLLVLHVLQMNIKSMFRFQTRHKTFLYKMSPTYVHILIHIPMNENISMFVHTGTWHTFCPVQYDSATCEQSSKWLANRLAYWEVRSSKGPKASYNMLCLTHIHAHSGEIIWYTSKHSKDHPNLCCFVDNQVKERITLKTWSHS